MIAISFVSDFDRVVDRRAKRGDAIDSVIEVSIVKGCVFVVERSSMCAWRGQRVAAFPPNDIATRTCCISAEIEFVSIQTKDVSKSDSAKVRDVWYCFKFVQIRASDSHVASALGD